MLGLQDHGQQAVRTKRQAQAVVTEGAADERAILHGARLPSTR